MIYNLNPLNKFIGQAENRRYHLLPDIHGRIDRKLEFAVYLAEGNGRRLDSGKTRHRWPVYFGL